VGAHSVIIPVTTRLVGSESAYPSTRTPHGLTSSPAMLATVTSR
jgi:hypothetical protein